jgi:HAD superfamily hydrolase (TIGR01509 family)
MRRRGWMNAAKRSAPVAERRPPVVHVMSLRTRPHYAVGKARAFIFDVEGTLVDSVLPTLHCWCETLAEFGFVFRTADLHQHSGMDGADMLSRLLPREAFKELKDWILSKQDTRYRADYLPQIRAFPGTRGLLETIRAGGAKIALATTCNAEDLTQYRKCMNVDDLVDAVVCGDDVKRGKPHPDLLLLALKRLGVTHPGEAVAVGDTPYDAEAARHARMPSIGMLSGLFPRADLLAAGHSAIFLDPISLYQAIAEPAAA